MSNSRSNLTTVIYLNQTNITNQVPDQRWLVQLNFDIHPCARERAAQRRYAAVQSAAVSIADAKSGLPDFTLPSYDKTKLLNLINETELTLTHVNFSVYFKRPRPTYNESRDLLINLNDQTLKLNRLLCRNTWLPQQFMDYDWLEPKLNKIRLGRFFNASLPWPMVKTLNAYANNMTILAKGRDVMNAFTLYRRINNVLTEIIKKCVVIQCASTINYSLNPPRIGSSEWFYQQLNYTAKIIKTPIPADLTLRLILLGEGNKFEIPGYKLFHWGVDRPNANARELIVNQINNCANLKCVNKINLALSNTRYFQNYTYLEYLASPRFPFYPNNNTAAFLNYAANVSAYLDYTAYMNNHPCVGFFCDRVNRQEAYVIVMMTLMLSLMGLIGSYRPAANAISNACKSAMVSRLFSAQRSKDKSSDDEEHQALVYGGKTA
jgi:hypothetical protein